MPIAVTLNDFRSPLLTSTGLTYYKANAGDRLFYSCVLLEEISVATGQNILSYNAAQKTISIGNGNFLAEGFKQGDGIEITIYDSAGAVISQVTRNLVLVTPTTMVHDSTALTWYDTTLGQTLEILVEYKGTADKRNGLWLDVNHIPNTSAGTEFSLIDGEVTRFIFDLTGTVQNQIVVGGQVGLQSGEFKTTAVLQDLTNYTTSPNRRTYGIRVETIQSGVYTESYFNFSDCLKLYTRQNWQRVYGDPNNQLQFVVSPNADTGWFNEPFNADIGDSTLVQGISELDYLVGSSGQITVDYAGSVIMFGAAYIPTDETYYKNKPYSQSEITMIAPTQGSPTYPFAFTSSFPNPNGGSFTITITNPVIAGTLVTFDYTFTPNLAFSTFIEGREVGDRLFRFWIKAGKINWLLFDGQLTRQEIVGEPLEMVLSDFTDHSENVTDIQESELGFTGNIEDDLAFIGKFLIPLNSTVDSVTANVEAVNTITGDSFLLQSAFFNFAGVPIFSGAYPINSTQETFTILQNTNVKRFANLNRDTSIDIAGKYGLKIHFPVIFRWEYWLAQSNAAADFYPNEQTKNWFNYDDLANWSIRVSVEAVIDSLTSKYEEFVTIKNYDSDADIKKDIFLIRDIDNTQVNVIIEGEIMRVVATHELTPNNEQWLIPSVWGTITCEPFENAPRFDCSSVVPFDNNPLNPLSPLTGSFCELTFPTPKVARLECFFNSDKINLANGVKFTSKIKGCVITEVKNFKLLTDGSVKLNTDGLPKIIS
jgi:hypothetical protein